MTILSLDCYVSRTRERPGPDNLLGGAEILWDAFRWTILRKVRPVTRASLRRGNVILWAAKLPSDDGSHRRPFMVRVWNS
jgi:hypothetical protein